MSDPEIQWVTAGTAVDVKLFPAPGVRLSSKCPKCGKTVTMDLGESHVSLYLTAGVAMPIWMHHYHETDGSTAEWQTRIVTHLGIEQTERRDR